MQQQEPHYISLKAFFESAIFDFDITKHPDLSELRTKIEKL